MYFEHLDSLELMNATYWTVVAIVPIVISTASSSNSLIVSWLHNYCTGSSSLLPTWSILYSTVQDQCSSLVHLVLQLFVRDHTRLRKSCLLLTISASRDRFRGHKLNCVTPITLCRLGNQRCNSVRNFRLYGTWRFVSLSIFTTKFYLSFSICIFNYSSFHLQFDYLQTWAASSWALNLMINSTCLWVSGIRITES